MSIVYYNSDFINEEDLIINVLDRGVNYGDGFFETIKIINSKPFNFSSHYLRFCFACDIFKFNFEYSENGFIKILLDLIEKNKIINGSARVRVSRRGGGKYLPLSMSVNILITLEKGIGFEQNPSVSLCLYTEEVKTTGKLSNIKSLNSLVSILAAIYAKNNKYDNTLLLNIHNLVIEASNSNIFVLKDNNLYTPKITDGCIDGTMRKWILQKRDVVEGSLLITDIKQADEVFLSNSINGVIPVRTINFKTTIEYNNKIAKDLQQELINSSLDL